MSRKKWAWDAYLTAEGVDQKLMAMDALEMAIIEDFTDDVYERFEVLDSMLEQAMNTDIKLGLILARNALRETLDNRYI